ncbi:hypothetical protein K227x_51440 [Rubripirellula lacrimiformis]|uniref:Uncharacterized protein n=1 Tax=Rubripirellula lacrimiformis TaxID=1930273 RepID=A0A517NI25_9BACT|nr:hypothetical protein [Rubripirellula lacrimiformis]QDT06728.1 hypothetical protein K227x_51440 [Rubripirellula lacrimiformis]
MAAYDDLNVKRIFTVGIISVVVTAVTALAVQVLYYTMNDWQEAETAAQSDYRRQNLILSEQTAQVSEFGVDSDTGRITIPVKDAIEMMVKDKANGSSNEKKSGSDET